MVTVADFAVFYWTIIVIGYIYSNSLVNYSLVNQRKSASIPLTSNPNSWADSNCLNLHVTLALKTQSVTVKTLSCRHTIVFKLTGPQSIKMNLNYSR